MRTVLTIDVPTGIAETLASPVATTDIEGLARSWFETNITWNLAGYSQLVADVGLPGRLRGAFGRALMASASPEALGGLPCPWSPPCAFDALFRKQGRMNAGLDFPSPWIIRTDAHRGDLLITLRLFGFAADWAPAAVEAMSSSILTGTNFADDTRSRLQAPTISGRTIKTVSGLTPPSGGTDSSLLVTFATPVALSSHSAIEHPRSLMKSAFQRLSGLARWHNLALEEDLAGTREAVERLGFTWRKSESVAWSRGSRRQDRTIKMVGYLGTLLIGGDEADVALVRDALGIATRCHIGADVAFGCGRFDVT